MSAYTEIKRQLQAIPIPRALLDLITKKPILTPSSEARLHWSTECILHQWPLIRTNFKGGLSLGREQKGVPVEWCDPYSLLNNIITLSVSLDDRTRSYKSDILKFVSLSN